MNETTTDDKSSRSVAQGSWGSIPAAVRTVLLGFLLLHAGADFIVLPMQYGVIPSAGEWACGWQGWLSLLA